MKTKLQAVMWSAMLASGVMLVPTLRAQDEAGAEKPKQERREGGPRGGGIEQLRERLGLSDEQVEQLKPIMAAQNEEIQALRKEFGPGADRTALREKMKAIREKYKPQVEALLTAEQKEKLAKLQERRPGGPGGPGGGDRPEGAPPAPPAAE